MYVVGKTNEKEQKNNESVYEDMMDSERQAADYLKESDLWWWYEHPVFLYGEKKRSRVWAPDFYIPKLGMFIEGCGKEREDYKYRKLIYRKKRGSCHLPSGVQGTEETEEILGEV